MNAASELLSSKFGEPAFDLIDPGRRCWRKMHVIVRSPHQPGFGPRGLVGGVVVHDDMDIQSVWDVGIDLFEKIQKLGGAVALVAFADHEPGGDIEGRE